MEDADHSVKPGAESRRFVVAIHGGGSDSGSLNKEFEAAVKVALTDIIDLALKRLVNGESALQVAEAAVVALEDAAVFNAAKGSAFNVLHEHELEAAIVDGSTRRTGAVAIMRSTRNPVKAARCVLESGRHAFIAGPAADEFAKISGLEQVSNDYFDTEHRRPKKSPLLPSKPESCRNPEFGTVGAVVLDVHGNLAAASSTGGLHGKDLGRIGDTAIPGAGIWADDSSAIICSGSGDEILRRALTGKIVGLAHSSSLRKAVNTIVTEFVQDTGDVCFVLALDNTGQVTVECTGRLFITAMGSGMLGSTESQRGIHFACNTIPFLPRHEFMRDGHFVAGAYRYPSTPGQAVVIAEGATEFSSLGLHDFISLFQFTRKAAQALSSHTRVRRCAIASDGKMVHLIPLHGLSDDWNHIRHDAKIYYPTYPGYLTSEDAPKGLKDVLDNIQQRLVAVSGLREPFDETFLGDTSDQNLFARIVRGEIEQWRIWESNTHIAFLTPFGNTPGFTVLIPRQHLSSDVFALSEEDYEALLNATYIVADIIKCALGVTRVGIFFEGFEIDYTHVKLVPVHANGPPQIVVPPAEFQTRYPGFITTQPGPREKDMTVLDSVAKGAQQWLASQARIRAPRAWAGSPSALSGGEESRGDWYRGALAIQDAVFKETVRYFSGVLGYRFVLLPVTTGAISSPMGLGSDSVPVSIDLFGEKTYLADSMQFYLERMLRLDNGSGGVYYVAPSFRGEDHDAMHLNQFFHVECELVGGMDAAISVAEGYIITVIRQLLKRHALLISTFAGDTTHLQDILSLYASHGDKLPRITLDEALALSAMPDGGWEHVVQEWPDLGRCLTRKGEQALISHFGGALWVTEMDHMSVPFYQAYRDKGKAKALCADLLIGLGETLGLGQRHVYAEDVENALLDHHIDKGKETYDWYINLRRDKMLQTSGWGLGLERFLAWLFQHDDIRDIPLIPMLKRRAS